MDTNNFSELQLANDELFQFYGTVNYYKHSSGYYFTDGIHYARDFFECYWLIDKIFITMRFKSVPNDRLLVWTLERDMIIENGIVKNRTETFYIRCTLGNREIYQEVIKICDFSADKFVMYFNNNILFLPSED